MIVGGSLPEKKNPETSCVTCCLKILKPISSPVPAFAPFHGQLVRNGAELWLGAGEMSTEGTRAWPQKPDWGISHCHAVFHGSRALQVWNGHIILTFSRVQSVSCGAGTAFCILCRKELGVKHFTAVFVGSIFCAKLSGGPGPPLI